MTEAPIHIDADVLVIGAGGAGMYAALAAARAGAERVVLVDKNLIGRGGATVMAQMTVAAALGETEPDSAEAHFEDTLEAGRGLCDQGLASLLCEEGPARVREMDAWKVGWARAGGRIRQVAAPGHRRRRCCYVDILNTGPAVAATLRRRLARVDAITRVSGLVVTDPVVDGGRLIGAVGFELETGRAVCLAARATVVATGGLTKLYARSSASANMAGEGYAFALAAGAVLVDMEFVQFFPIGHLFPRLVGMDPIMWDPFRYKLGGRLLNGRHEEFLPRYGGTDAGRYTATRDLATHAIWREVRAGRGSPHGGAYLSFTHVGEAALREAFGPVIDRLRVNGIDLTEAPVEVAPIAHYHMGGIQVDMALGARVPGLYAAGEAVGGANGANRLSGNAITEALVFGQRAGASAAFEAARTACLAAGRRASGPGYACRAARGTGRDGDGSRAVRRIAPADVGAGRPVPRPRGARRRAGMDPPSARRRTSPHARARLRRLPHGACRLVRAARRPRSGGGGGRRGGRAAREPGRPSARGLPRERPGAREESDRDARRGLARAAPRGGGLRPWAPPPPCA